MLVCQVFGELSFRFWAIGLSSMFVFVLISGLFCRFFLWHWNVLHAAFIRFSVHRLLGFVGIKFSPVFVSFRFSGPHLFGF